MFMQYRYVFEEYLCEQVPRRQPPFNCHQLLQPDLCVHSRPGMSDSIPLWQLREPEEQGTREEPRDKSSQPRVTGTIYIYNEQSKNPAFY